MTSRGADSFPPEDRDLNCRQCSGYGWVALTAREQDLVEQLDSYHQKVFGSKYFPDYLGGGAPIRRFCPECCGRERRMRVKGDFAQWRLDLRALRTLVARVRRGETFSSSQLNREDWWMEEAVEVLSSEVSGTFDPYESVLMKLAKSPRVAPSSASRKKSRPNPNPRVAPSSASRKKSRPNPSLVEDLTQLANLRNSGALTKKEFERAKQKLLSSISPEKQKPQARRQEDEDMGPPDLPMKKFKER